MPFSAFWASKFALKFMLTILGFERKEGYLGKKGGEGNVISWGGGTRGVLYVNKGPELSLKNNPVFV
jgi:hypothetical protein